MRETFWKGVVFSSGVVLVAVVAWLAYLAYDTRQKALRGDAAATFIEQANRPQQAAAPAAAVPAPTPPAK